MSDRELIRLMALTWLANGGDLEGYIWSMTKVKDTIEEIEKELNHDQPDITKE